MHNILSRIELKPFEQAKSEKMTEKVASDMLRRLPLDDPAMARQLADDIITLFLYEQGHYSLGEAWECASQYLPLTIDELEEWDEEAY